MTKRTSRANGRPHVTGRSLRACVMLGVAVTVGAAHGRRLEGQEWLSWTAYWENDSFVKRRRSVTTGDDSYTNGVRFVVSRNPLRNTGAWAWADALGEWWAHSWLTRDRFDDSTSPTPSIVVGQNFFTPRVITDYEVDPADRPFAGILYAGLRLDLTEDEQNVGRGFSIRFQHSVELDAGLMGPGAQSRRIQSGVHVLRESRIPKGWPHEIGTDPLLQLNYMTRARLGWSFLDVVPHAGALLGNPQTAVYGGLTARLGYGLSDFPALTIPMTVRGEPGRKPFEIAVIAGVEGRAFARQAFLDGRFFGTSPSVEKKARVHDLRLGGTLRVSDWRVSYTYLDRSDEIGGPFAGHQDFGSVAFSYEPGRTSRPEVDGSWMFRRFHFEAGLGDGGSSLPGRGRQRGVGMHVGAGIGLPAFRPIRLEANRVIVGVEITGIGREGPRPPTGENHADEFLMNRLVTLGWRPFGRGPGPGILHVRGGIGSGAHKTQLVPPLAGTIPLCPADMSHDSPEQRFCERVRRGLGLMVGGGYGLSVGRQLSVGVDLSWNRLRIDDETPTFFVPAFTIRYHPSG